MKARCTAEDRGRDCSRDADLHDTYLHSEPNEDVPWLATDRSPWDQAVRAWLEQTAQASGLGQIVHLTEIKARPWSMVVKVTFQDDVAYFKACGRGGRHEAGLLAYLGLRWAEHIPGLLAADHARSWILMADAGQPVSDAMSAEHQIGALHALLPLYGKMQLASIPSVAEMTRMGLPDRRLARLPGLLEGLLSSHVLQAARSLEQANSLRDSVLRLLPALERCCTAMTASPYAATLDHGDIHTGNILVKGGSYRLADWGDACISHPFCSLGVLLEAVLKIVPEIDRPRTAAQLVARYLEPWSSLASPATLRVEVQAALWIAHVLRALDFAHMCRTKDESSGADWKDFIADSLVAWIDYPCPVLAQDS